MSFNLRERVAWIGAKRSVARKTVYSVIRKVESPIAKLQYYLKKNIWPGYDIQCFYGVLAREYWARNY